MNGSNTVNVTCISANGTRRVYTINIQNNGGTAVKSDGERKYCDVNGDGRANITDAVVVFAHVSGRRPINKQNYPHADIDGNGFVNLADGMKIIKAIGIR